MEFDFKGQTAIVTGGTRGIGRAVSEAFLKAGAKVIATYLSNKEEAKKYYSLAIENITANSSLTQLIQIKLDDLN